jgi:hypothetical protein
MVAPCSKEFAMTERGSVIRRIALTVVLLAGTFWLVSTLALSYPEKTQGVDNLTNAFRPVFTNAGIKQSQTDIATINNFAAEFQTKAVPALAGQLHVTPAQLVTSLSQQYPDVGKGVAQLPTSLPYFNHLVAGLAAQQSNFHQADAIPTKDLPATTVHWLFVILGVLAIALALLGLVRATASRTVLVASAVLGVAVIAVSLILSVPGKAKAVDDLTNAFRPVFTEQGAAQTREYLTTVQAMDTQLTSSALPGLAKALGVSPTDLAGSLAKNFPAVATGLQEMPQILNRFDHLVTGIQSNLKNFRLADSIPTSGTHTTLLEYQLAVPAGVLVLAALVGVALTSPSRRKQRTVSTNRQAPVTSPTT